MYNVFVYGTLRKEETNDHYLLNAKFLNDSCWIFGELYDTGMGYPAVKSHPSFKVIGELYEVTDEELKLLDELEGFIEGATNNLYDRKKRMVYTRQGSHEAYTYYGADHLFLNARRIVSGDWKAYRMGLEIK